MSHDVFISYSTVDKPTADAACNTLESLGVRCWIAPRDILPGMDWSAEIIDAIASCRVFLLVFSSASNQSDQVKRELCRAVDNGKPIIPFRIEDVPLSKHMLYYIGTPHWLDALTAPLGEHLNRLAESVERWLGAQSSNRIDARVIVIRPKEHCEMPSRCGGPGGKQWHGEVVDLFETSRLALRIDGTAGTRNICLLRGPNVHLGKHRHNDIVLRVLPPSKENDAASLQISRHHAMLSVQQHEAIWHNLDCPNGTLVGTRRMGPEESCPITQGMSIVPAGAIALTCDLCPASEQISVKAYTDFEHSLGKGRTVGSIEPTANCVRLRRGDALAALEQYVVMDRCAVVGSHPLAAVLIAHPSVAPQHARVFWLGRSFWLEPYRADCVITVDGDRVPENRLVPLHPGMRVALGEVDAIVAEYQQYYLDTSPPSSNLRDHKRG